MELSLLVYCYYFVLLLVSFAQRIFNVRLDLGIEGPGLGLGLGFVNLTLTTSLINGCSCAKL